MIRACSAVLVLAVLCGSVRAQGVDASFPKQVAQAIDKGVEWLKKRQVQKGVDKGSWGTGTNPLYGGGTGESKEKIGYCALALFALLSCDVDPEDPVIVEGFTYIDKYLDPAWKTDNVNVDTTKEQVSTYEAAVVIMAIEAYGNGVIDKALRAAKKDPKTVKPRPAIQLPKDKKSIVAAATKWLLLNQSKDGGWRYGEPMHSSPSGIQQDTSATQFVLLGLVSATRLGEKVDPKVWEKAANWNLKCQEQDGPPLKVILPGGEDGKTVLMKEGDKSRGFPYTPGSTEAQDAKAQGGMTACGICSLILCRAQLAKAAPKKELNDKMTRGIFDGLAWLQTNWSVSSNPGGHRSHYYYLYGLERVGVLGTIDKIGEHNWYIEGATLLIGAQKPEGLWDSKTEIEPCDVLDTCFALLFLKKATIPVTLLTR